MKRENLNTFLYADDLGRFFCQESVKSLQDIELAVNKSITAHLNLANPFESLAFQVEEDFYFCSVEPVFDVMNGKLCKLSYKVKPFTDTTLYSRDRAFKEKIIAIEFEVVKKGLAVKSFMSNDSTFYVDTDDENGLFGRFYTIRGDLFRVINQSLTDTINNSDFSKVERHLNAYITYQSAMFPNLKKYFNTELLVAIERNQAEYFNYRNAIEENEHKLEDSDLLQPDELALNKLSLVCGIDYPAFLARHFAKQK